jgi:uncharacterized membrane protein YsdA (DUF1294 family)
MIWPLLSAYLLLNLIAFLLMGRDKSLARRRQWRIPEDWFFTLALVGGAPGVWLGMQFFHHKTKHNSFIYGIPALFVLNLGIIYAVWTRLG